MKRVPWIKSSLLVCLISGLAAEPLKVAVSSDSGEISDGVIRLLERAGHEAAGDLSAATLDSARVLVLHREKPEPLPETARAAVEAFAGRGGGIVILHNAIAAGDAAWFKPISGAGWTEHSRSFSSEMMLHVATDQHPVISGASSFDIHDETIYDLDRTTEGIRVLASAFTPKLTDHPGDKRPPARADRANIFDSQPQMWTFENTLEGGKPHRAFIGLQRGMAACDHPSFRTFLLRAVAWTAGRDDLDAGIPAEDLAALRYPPGGPKRAEDTVKQFALEPGFAAGVVAAEPLVNKPIAVQWDAAGRMWIAETPEYPNGRRESIAPSWRETGVLHPQRYDRPAEDKISVLSEPDENGRLTKKTVFHEGLELVTGFCLYRDGVIAIHQPDIVWLRDTDGDGQADETVRLYTGFAPGDTHFVANHLIAAPDGWIYASMGGGAEARRIDDPEKMVRIGAGVFRFRPDGSAIEQVSSKGGNGFGLDITSDGELFFNQATSGNPVQHVALTEKTLALGKAGNISGAQNVIEQRRVAAPLPERIPLMQIDQVGRYSSACSSLIYEGGAWPDEWTNSIFCTEPILNIVHREALVPRRATFTGRMVRTDAEFLHSPDDYWFRPVDVALGPDGAIYVLDFYNPVIAHNDTRGPLHSRSGASVRPDREHYFGRIYRIQHEQAKDLAVPDLTKASVEEKVAALSHPNRVVRFNALNLLVEDGDKSVAPAIQPVAESSDFAPARILALWGLQRLGSLETRVLAAALTDKSPAVRKNAALIVEEGGIKAVRDTVVANLRDPDPRTRIAMLRALAAIDADEKSAAALVALFPDLRDDLTRSAAIAASAPDRAGILRAALSAQRPEALTRMAGSIADLLIEERNADAFASLIPALASAPDTAGGLKILLLQKAARVNGKPGETVSAEIFRSLLKDPDDRVRAAALPLALAWSDADVLRPAIEGLLPDFLRQAADPGLPGGHRILLLESLVDARSASEEILPAVGKLLGDHATPAEIRRAALDALRRSNAPEAGELLVSLYGGLDLSLQPAAFDALLSRVEWVRALLDAVEQRKVSFTQLAPNDIFRLRSHPAREIAARATAILDELRRPDADKDKLVSELIPAVTQTGDIARGKELFSQACATCHRYEGAGVEIGPTLDGIGAHGPEQLLISIVDPNRQIDAGYELYTVETHDGQFHAGMIAQQNDARVVLRSMAGDVEIPVNTIKTRTNTHRSLMPEGLEALGGDALRDIIAYICGGESRYRVLDLSKAFTADSRRGLYHSAESLNDTVPFTRHGIVDVEGTPFNIVEPGANPYGGNLLVLRGGGRRTFSHSYPRQVEIPVGFEATAFHFLGGVAGWGASAADPEGREIMKVVVVFRDGGTEESALRDGVEFSDYVRRVDVPGSEYVPDLTRGRQIRRFAIPVKGSGVVEKLVLSSPGYGPAPTTAAITAEMK